MRRPQNDEIANLLDRVADLLEAQHASIYRVRAYRAGAATVRKSETALAERLGRDEDDELETLPSIGKSIAAAIREFATSGRLRLLERLEGQTSPHDLFSTVPGIGKALARRIEEACREQRFLRHGWMRELAALRALPPTRVEVWDVKLTD